MNDNAIYTHDEAARIVELFEDVLDEYGIRVPSPEDGEHESDNEEELYGSVYWSLMDGVEERIINFLQTHEPDILKEFYPFSFSCTSVFLIVRLNCGNSVSVKGAHPKSIMSSNIMVNGV